MFSSSSPQCPHDLAEARAFAVHQQVDAKQLRGDPQSAEDGDDQDGHAGDKLPGGHAGDAEPKHYQHGCGERHYAEHNPDGAIRSSGDTDPISLSAHTAYHLSYRARGQAVQ